MPTRVSFFLFSLPNLFFSFQKCSAVRDNNEETKASRDRNGRELIINGHEAPRGRYPYFSTLHHECGGALIAPDAVITAGHCLPSHRHSVQPHVGTFSFYDQEGVQVFDIVAMERHPHWRLLGDDEFRNDVSILFLNGTADNTPYLRLNRNESLPYPGEPVTAMGVGWYFL